MKHSHSWTPLTPEPANAADAFFYHLRHGDAAQGCSCGAVGYKSRGRKQGGGAPKVHVIKDAAAAARIREAA